MDNNEQLKLELSKFSAYLALQAERILDLSEQEECANPRELEVQSIILHRIAIVLDKMVKGMTWLEAEEAYDANFEEWKARKDE